MEAAGAKLLTPEEEALRRNTDCVYFLASPLTCKKVRLRRLVGLLIYSRLVSFGFPGGVPCSGRLELVICVRSGFGALGRASELGIGGFFLAARGLVLSMFWKHPWSSVGNLGCMMTYL
jgi:hypothetical protein